MTEPQASGWIVRGSAEACEQALDRLHLAADVTGVREGSGWIEVWLAGPWPDVPLPEGLTVQRLPAPDRSWTGREQDRAVFVLPHLIVRPPWVERPTGFDGIDLVVPRGGAFGSGEHGSTQAALQVLDEIWRAAGPPASFMDVGTGSGILALYAREQGVASLQACDLQESAAVAAAELLGMPVVHGGADALDGPVDMVVANLNGRELVAARPCLLAHWGRVLVLSGMRPDEVAGVLRPLPRPVIRREVRGYVACAFVRR